MRRSLAAALFTVGLPAACSGGTSLLAGRAATGVPGSEKLTDGAFARDGEGWDSPPALVLPPGAALVWDLGAPTAFDSLTIQADNNDDYVFSSSDDVVTWYELWVVPPGDAPGLASRTQKWLHLTARFHRLV